MNKKSFYHHSVVQNEEAEVLGNAISLSLSGLFDKYVKLNYSIDEISTIMHIRISQLAHQKTLCQKVEELEKRFPRGVEDV